MSQETKENMLLFGSTGYIGTYITKQIVKNKSSFGRIVVFTSPSTAEKKGDVIKSLKDSGVEIVIGDASKKEDVVGAMQGMNPALCKWPSLSADCSGIDTIVSAVGRTAIAVQMDWIKWTAEVPSVKRFFPSEYGTDIEYNVASAKEPPHQNKIKVRKALKEAANLVHTYVVTGPYADGRTGAYFGYNPARAELGGFDVKSKKAVLTGDGTGKISFTSLEEYAESVEIPPGYWAFKLTFDSVGKLTVKALLHPEASKNRALKVNSFTTTGNEIVAEFEKQTGDKWDVSYTSIERLRELEKEAYAKGDPAATIFTLRRLWAEGGTIYEKRDNDLIDGNDMESLADTVRGSIQAQRAS
jgi:hypothetical protein